MNRCLFGAALNSTGLPTVPPATRLINTASGGLSDNTTSWGYAYSCRFSVQRIEATLSSRPWLTQTGQQEWARRGNLSGRVARRGRPHPGAETVRGQETLSIDAHQADRGALLRLGELTVQSARLVAEQFADQGAGLCLSTTLRPGGLSDRPGRASRHQPSGVCLARHSHGP